eukprot:CFRG8149T1
MVLSSFKTVTTLFPYRLDRTPVVRMLLFLSLLSPTLIYSVTGQRFGSSELSSEDLRELMNVDRQRTLGIDNTNRVLRINEIQTMGTHNSFKLPVPPRVGELLQDIDKITQDTAYYEEMSYGMPPLEEQLSAGCRHFELDLAYDPTGTYYSDPAGLNLPDMGVLANIVEQGRGVVDTVVKGANAVGDFFSDIFGRSLLINTCPNAHPYSYMSGQLCCGSRRERDEDDNDDLCDGGALLYESTCCWGNNFVPCPYDSCEDTTTSTKIDTKPGFKTLHVPDIDFESHCTTFVSCLSVLKKWSDNHPRHLPLVILLNLNDNSLAIGIEQKLSTPVFNFLKTVNVLPLTMVPEMTRPLFLALEEEATSVFDEKKIITPDIVRGLYDSLEEAILTGNAWPTVKDSLGKVMFIVDGPSQPYQEGNKNLQGRLFFVNEHPGTPASATIVMNDPYDPRITEMVSKGYFVRTRADGRPLPRNPYKKAETAMRSGAQLISTDYLRMKRADESMTAEEWSSTTEVNEQSQPLSSPKSKPQKHGHMYYYSVTHYYQGGMSQSTSDMGVSNRQRRQQQQQGQTSGEYSVRFDPTCNPLLVKGPCPLFQDGGWNEWYYGFSSMHF